MSIEGVKSTERERGSLESTRKKFKESLLEKVQSERIVTRVTASEILKNDEDKLKRVSSITLIKLAVCFNCFHIF